MKIILNYKILAIRMLWNTRQHSKENSIFIKNIIFHLIATPTTIFHPITTGIISIKQSYNCFVFF